MSGLEPGRPGTHVVLGAGPAGRADVAALAARGIRPVVVTRSGTRVPEADARRADRTDPGEAAAARAGALLAVAENMYGYGPLAGPLVETLPLTATTRTGSVRAQMWRELESAHQAGRLAVVGARAADLFGPGVEASAVGGRFFRAILRARPVDVVGDPELPHTDTHVADFGEALVRLAEAPSSWGRAWHVPNAPTVSTPGRPPSGPRPPPGAPRPCGCGGWHRGSSGRSHW